MTDTIPRRDTRRPFTKPIRLRLKTWEQWETFQSENVSRGGIFLKTTTPLSAGTQVVVKLVAPNDQEMDLDAEVVRTVALGDPARAPGMGLRFLLPTEEARARMEDVVRAAAPAPPPVLAEVELFDEATMGKVDHLEGLASLKELPSITAGKTALAEERWADARQAFANALAVDSRDRSVRALYHLAAGFEAKHEGRAQEARKHFETVLVFDKTCEPAVQEVRAVSAKPEEPRAGVFGKLFGRKTIPPGGSPPK